MEHSIHILEILTLVLGGGAVAARILPQLKETIVFFQVALYLTQIFGFYIRKNPGQQRKLKHFVTEMLDHYLKTHPEGQIVSQESNIDEKVAALVRSETARVPDELDHLCKLLGLRVDKR